MEDKHNEKEPKYFLWMILLSLLPILVLLVTEVFGDQMIRKAVIGEETNQFNSTSKP